MGIPAGYRNLAINHLRSHHDLSPRNPILYRGLYPSGGRYPLVVAEPHLLSQSRPLGTGPDTRRTLRQAADRGPGAAYRAIALVRARLERRRQAALSDVAPPRRARRHPRLDREAQVSRPGGRARSTPRAVRLTRERCGREAEVGFAAEHANSKMFLPEPFNTPFRRSERKAAKSLEKVLADWEGARRRRKL